MSKWSEVHTNHIENLFRTWTFTWNYSQLLKNSANSRKTEMKKKVALKNSILCQPQFGVFCQYWTFSGVLGFTCSKLTQLCSPGAESVPSFSPEAIEALLVKICSILCLEWLFPQLNGSAWTSWTSNGCNVTNNARFPPGKKTGHPWLSRQHGCAIFTNKKCNFGGVWHHQIFLVEFFKILDSENPSILRSTFFEHRFSTASRCFQKQWVLLRESSGSK